ncbi:MAG: pyruvate, water dikinase regulatory protein [Clostridiaceae bacterium]
MVKIYAVSDSIGETAELVAKATASQFTNDVEVIRVSYLKTTEEIIEFIEKIEDKENSIIVSTIVLVDVREFLVERCTDTGIRIINVLGPCINMVSRMLNRLPDNKPGAIWDMDEEYNKRIEAMEFAMRYDDSRDHSGIKHADVVLVGLSRTSKTPLCMYLANKGIKALNVPLMPEIGVPEELKEIDRKKVIGLTIDPMHLIDIRKHRLDKFSRLSPGVQYANEERILTEFEFADKVMRRLGCKVIDVTTRAIEDTALIIMENLGIRNK